MTLSGRPHLGAVVLLLLLWAVGCGDGEKSSDGTPRQTGVSLGLRSPAFAEGGRIPSKYTCDGENISPPLTWNRVPVEARSLAIVMQDENASGFTHWTLWELSRRSRGLNAGRIPSGAAEGRNSFDELGYGGPCPPEGDSAHKYVFRLHALNADLDVTAGASPAAVLNAITQHSIASGAATGTYRR